MTTRNAIETTRFGLVEFDAQDVVTFTDGLLGFGDHKRFVVIQHKEGSPFCWLQCVDVGDLAFLVIDPGYYVADYAPEMPDEVAASLEISEDSPRLVYTIATIPKGDPTGMTLNLAGPLLINLENRKARQVVVEDQRYPIRYRVFAEADTGQPAA
jgi:flagellar assembly factor FliW